ncbi:MAG: hypothetical protein RJA94_2006 [Pseudomonadota bacterium]|jgi:hypothetical protein
MPDEERHSPFQILHKALRFGHCRMLSELGARDFGDDATADRLLPQLVRQLDLYRAVANATQAALLAELGQRGLAAPASSGEDHAGHLMALAELQSLVRAVAVAAPQRRRPAGRSIYRCFALYASADMERMDEEETLLLSSLHLDLDDDTLRAIEAGTLGELTTEHCQSFLQLLVTALAPAEFDAMICRLRRHMEPSRFAAAVEPAVEPLMEGGRVAAA